LNDSKYGYDIKDNVMRLSLLKAAIHPDPHADEGEHQFTYSLLPHKGTWQDGETVKEAWELNNPLTCTEGAPEQKSVSLFFGMNGNIMIDAVKKAENSDAIVVRVHEYEGRRSNVQLRSDFKINNWQECDLMERPIQDSVYRDKIEFKINPYEIKTFLVEFTK